MYQLFAKPNGKRGMESSCWTSPAVG
jgi:hypothetical protein